MSVISGRRRGGGGGGGGGGGTKDSFKRLVNHDGYIREKRGEKCVCGVGGGRGGGGENREIVLNAQPTITVISGEGWGWGVGGKGEVQIRWTTQIKPSMCCIRLQLLLLHLIYSLLLAFKEKQNKVIFFLSCILTQLSRHQQKCYVVKSGLYELTRTQF